jgi:hypothetical protein
MGQTENDNLLTRKESQQFAPPSWCLREEGRGKRGRRWEIVNPIFLLSALLSFLNGFKHVICTGDD